MSEFRRSLMMVNNSSDMDMYDIIENNVFALVPGGSFTGGTQGHLFTLKAGHTYKCIMKCRQTVPQAMNLICYLTNANSPNQTMGRIDTGDTMSEFTYTHGDGLDDYAWIGIYTANTSGTRTSTYNCVVYIEDIT